MHFSQIQVAVLAIALFGVSFVLANEYETINARDFDDIVERNTHLKGPRSSAIDLHLGYPIKHGPGSATRAPKKRDLNELEAPAGHSRVFSRVSPPTFGRDPKRIVPPAFGRDPNRIVPPAFGRDPNRIVPPAFGRDPNRIVPPAFGRDPNRTRPPAFGRTPGRIAPGFVDPRRKLGLGSARGSSLERRSRQGTSTKAHPHRKGRGRAPKSSSRGADVHNPIADGVKVINGDATPAPEELQ